MLSQLRIYVHYQPSFYHFHVHFTYLMHTPPGKLYFHSLFRYCEKSIVDFDQNLAFGLF